MAQWGQAVAKERLLRPGRHNLGEPALRKADRRVCTRLLARRATSPSRCAHLGLGQELGCHAGRLHQGTGPSEQFQSRRHHFRAKVKSDSDVHCSGRPCCTHNATSCRTQPIYSDCYPASMTEETSLLRRRTTPLRIVERRRDAIRSARAVPKPGTLHRPVLVEQLNRSSRRGLTTNGISIRRVQMLSAKPQVQTAGKFGTLGFERCASPWAGSQRFEGRSGVQCTRARQRMQLMALFWS